MKTKLALENRFIVAYVSYEGESFTYKFGRNQSVSHIWATLPKLVTDELFARRVVSKVV